jgi:hypothetical protein
MVIGGGESELGVDLSNLLKFIVSFWSKDSQVSIFLRL